MANRTQNTNPEAEGLETGHVIPEIDAATLSVKKAFKVFEGGLKDNKNDPKKVEIAGQEFENPFKAYQKLQEALKYVKTYFGKNLKINLDEIAFKKFQGNMVGESTEKGAFIDPIMLMHPAIRLAHVIAHELAHNKKKIMNEGLVESYVNEWLEDGKGDIKHTYERATTKFKEFAKKCSKNGETKGVTKDLYELYYSGNFEGIYQLFEKRHMSKPKTEAEKDADFKLFKEVFPELHYEAKREKAGYFGLKRPPIAEEAAKKAASDKEETGAKIYDFAAYKKRISDTEEQVRKTGTL